MRCVFCLSLVLAALCGCGALSAAEKVGDTPAERYAFALDIIETHEQNHSSIGPHGLYYVLIYFVGPAFKGIKFERPNFVTVPVFEKYCDAAFKADPENLRVMEACALQLLCWQALYGDKDTRAVREARNKTIALLRQRTGFTEKELNPWLWPYKKEK